MLDLDGDQVKITLEKSSAKENSILLNDDSIVIIDLSQLELGTYKVTLVLNDGTDRVNFDITFDLQEQKQKVFHSQSKDSLT